MKRSPLSQRLEKTLPGWARVGRDRWRVLWAMCVLTLVASVASPSASAFLGFGEYKYVSGSPLLTLHGPRQQNAITDLAAVLSGLLQNDGRGLPLPLVVYIHGRGHEPRKSFDDSVLYGISNKLGNGKILSKIEADNVRVLGFNWDSTPAFYNPVCSRPVENALAAGADFAALVRALDKHRKENAPSWSGRRVVLLVHSMGSFVLQRAMTEPGLADTIRTLFDIRIISASDAPASGHQDWIPYGLPGSTFVLTNPADEVLDRSMGCDSGPRDQAVQRLGVLSARELVPTSPRESNTQHEVLQPVVKAPGTTYVELEVGGRHRYFNSAGSDGNKAACAFVRTLMRGQVPDAPSAWRADGDATVLRISRSAATVGEACNASVPDVDDNDKDE